MYTPLSCSWTTCSEGFCPARCWKPYKHPDRGHLPPSQSSFEALQSHLIRSSPPFLPDTEVTATCQYFPRSSLVPFRYIGMPRARFRSPCTSRGSGHLHKLTGKSPGLRPASSSGAPHCIPPGPTDWHGFARSLSAAASTVKSPHSGTRGPPMQRAGRPVLCRYCRRLGPNTPGIALRTLPSD